MIARSLHPWDVNYREAIRIQEKLRANISLTNSTRKVSSIAGADVSYSKRGDEGIGAVVVLSYPGLEPIDEAFAKGKVSFPYIPGLLSFREAPLLIEVFQRLQRPPDVALYDGQGIAHPRSLGLASHMGLLLDLPSIGCAKQKLVGDFRSNFCISSKILAFGSSYNRFLFTMLSHSVNNSESKVKLNLA